MSAVAMQTFVFSAGAGFAAFFVFQSMEKLWLFVPATLFFIFFFYNMLVNSPKSKISALQRDIDREILFAGRFLLVKLYSGRPLLNALNDATKSYGVSSKYFRRIVNDIDTGMSIEEAIEKALQDTPSEKFQKILFQINNALKLGIDITGPLSSVLEEIARAQKSEITRYGKKLNSMTLFYMLIAIVIPSLGITITTIMLSFASVNIGSTTYIAILGVLILLQWAFLSLFKSIKPAVNL